MGNDFAKHSKKELDNPQLRSNLHKATNSIRQKRALAVAEKDNWESLRVQAESIRVKSLTELDNHLIQLENAVRSAGGIVHWASDSNEANEIITSIINLHKETEVIKVKSITTDEIGLNHHLELHGIHAIETDLAELIVQLAHDKPSHILVPAIHMNRHEIKRLFEAKITGGEPIGIEPAQIAEISRLYLRDKFLKTKIAISGVNFAAADTGTLAIVESEGNGRMCVTLPKVLISIMGIEKVIPSVEDMGVLMELLPRSSTGERMNPYTSLWTGIHENDGPEEFHLVILDNGRTNVLEDPIGIQALKCIRCSACLNVCPVYEKVGGHAYDSVYPGPIGAVLAPQLFGMKQSGSLPWASSLCGACFEVCPVRIDIPELLLYLRERSVAELGAFSSEKATFKGTAWILSSAKRFKVVESVVGFMSRYINSISPIIERRGFFSFWTSFRSIPLVPRESFRSLLTKAIRDSDREL